MTPEQAKDLQREMERLSKRISDGHLEPDDGAYISRVLAEVLAHIAQREEARSRKPRKN